MKELCLMASLRKRNGKWQAQVRRLGYSPRTKSFHNRTDAHRLALAYDPSVLERTTVDDLLTRYQLEVTPRKRGCSSEHKRIDVFKRYDWTALSLALITPQVFSQYRDKRLRQVKPGTVIRELGLLHSIFEVARREWDLPLNENPLAMVRKPKAASGRTRRLEENELQCLIRACSSGRNQWLESCIHLALETGMRRGEILNVRLCDIDFRNGLLTIPETKTDVPRVIPLTDRAIKVLRELSSGKCEPSTSLLSVTANAFRLSWERCKRRAITEVPTIKSLRFHDLRHEAVSRFFELGLTVPEVAAISGHKDPRMLFRYTHLKPQDIRAKFLQAQRED